MLAFGAGRWWKIRRILLGKTAVSVEDSRHHPLCTAVHCGGIRRASISC